MDNEDKFTLRGGKKTHYISLKVDDDTFEIIETMAEQNGGNRSLAVRNSIVLARIIMDPDLKLRELVEEQEWEKSLGEIIVPVPFLEFKLKMRKKALKKLMGG